GGCVTRVRRGPAPSPYTPPCRSLEYRLAGGTVRLEVPATRVSVPVGATASLGLEVAARPPDEAPSAPVRVGDDVLGELEAVLDVDRKSTRLNSSHVKSSYAGFCL